MGSSAPPPERGDRSTSLGELGRRFEADLARARARATALDVTAAELAAVDGRAHSPGGDIVATVDGDGVLVALKLADSLLRQRADRVGELIVAAVAAATEDAVARRRHRLQNLIADLSVPDTGGEQFGPLQGRR